MLLNGVEAEGIVQGDALDLITSASGKVDLIATDPPYAFGGAGKEHELSAVVAVVLRESAKLLATGGWMLVMSASSWRSMQYMVDAVRGIVTPVRVATWCKPKAKTVVTTSGWRWASVSVLAFRRGKSAAPSSELIDHIVASPITKGRRAELPREVADWMVAPFSLEGGKMFDPFAGSGALLDAAKRKNMTTVGFEEG